MADLVMHPPAIPIVGELLIKRIQIQLNEKEASIKALKQRLEDIQNIEVKKIELQIDMYEKEIEMLSHRLGDEKKKRPKIIEVNE